MLTQKNLLVREKQRLELLRSLRFHPNNLEPIADLQNKNLDLGLDFKPRKYILRLNPNSTKQSLSKKKKEIRKEIEEQYEDLY